MEAALSQHAWIVSDDFSLADVALAPYFQTLYQFGWMQLYEDRYPRVTTWYARCRERASYQTAVVADFSAELLAELREKGAQAWLKIQQHVSAS